MKVVEVREVGVYLSGSMVLVLVRETVEIGVVFCVPLVVVRSRRPVDELRMVLVHDSHGVDANR